MITKLNLTCRFDSLCRVAESVGLVPEQGYEWNLQIGSKLNGIAYRIFWRNVKTGGLHSAGTMGDFLGMTRAEAYEAMGQRLTALQAVWLSKPATIKSATDHLDGIEKARNVAPLSR